MTHKFYQVSDGDTVVIAAPFLPAPLKKELAVRVYGVDTPRKRTSCSNAPVKPEAKPLAFSLKISFKPPSDKWSYGWDKFGGRVLGDIILNGQSLAPHADCQWHAREYYGDAKQSWCQ
jgi:endonuclease YncB( thermonuclease family)